MTAIYTLGTHGSVAYLLAPTLD